MKTYRSRALAQRAIVRLVVGLGLVAATTTAGTSAFAQEKGFAVDRFDPAERGSDWFTAEALDLRGHGRFAAGALADYNRNALVATTNGEVRSSIVANQLVLNLGGNVVLFDRLRLGLNAPIAAYASGTTVATESQTFSSPQTTAFGDLRVTSDVRLFGEYGAPITMAVGAAVYLPTGSRSAYMSDGDVRFTPRALAAGKIGFFEWSARAGYAFRSEQTQIQSFGVGSELVFGAAAGVRFYREKILVGPELFGGMPAFDPDFGKRTNGLEALLGAHAKISDSVRASAGVGTGLTTGFGTPGLRALMGLEWAPGHEPARVPPQDHDDDGIADASDACPETRGVASSDPAKNGCPVAVAEAPPPAPEPPPVVAVVAVVAPPAPADRDGDGIVDGDDACPDEAGPANEDKAKNGCPKAHVVDSRIVITEQVRFRTASADLDPAGDSVLEAVLQVLQKHPEIQRIRVEGHTDNRGSSGSNLQLSKARAASVARWLRQRGLDEARVQSVGFGASQPITTNSSEEGRRENRRVEFHIVEDAHASR